MDPAGLGLPAARVLNLFDDRASAGDQLIALRDWLDQVSSEQKSVGLALADVMVYYIGHGQTDDAGHLSLLVRRSRRGLESETSIRTPDLARVLRVSAPHQRRSIILDCCFSEAAAASFLGMSSSLDQAVAAVAAKDLREKEPKRGTLLLCSSPLSEVSICPVGSPRTLFTGAVIDVLRNGVSTNDGAISFASLRDAAYDRMIDIFGASAPRPVLHQMSAPQGDLTRIGAFPNSAAFVPNLHVEVQIPTNRTPALLNKSEQPQVQTAVSTDAREDQTDASRRRLVWWLVFVAMAALCATFAYRSRSGLVDDPQTLTNSTALSPSGATPAPRLGAPGTLSLKPLRTVPLPAEGYNFLMAISPDGLKLFSTNGSDTYIWSTLTGKVINKLHHPRGDSFSINGIAFPSPSTIATIGTISIEGESMVSGVTLWDTRSWTPIRYLSKSQDLSISTSQDGGLLAAANDGVTLWTLPNFIEQKKFDVPGTVNCVQLSPDASMLYLTLLPADGGNARYAAYSIATRKQVGKAIVTNGASEGGGCRFVVTGGEKGQRLLLRAVGGERAIELETDLNKVADMGFSDDGSVFWAFLPSLKRIAFWSTSDGAAKLSVPTSAKAPVTHVEGDAVVSLSKNGAIAAVVDGAKSLSVWNLQEQRKIADLVGVTSQVTGVILSDDGASVAAISKQDKTLKFWRLPK
jgi:WD40 repeat protein